MKNVELKVFIWADDLSYGGGVVYMASSTDMSSIGYIKVGEVDVSAEVTVPDFAAIKALKAKRDELIAKQKAELAEFNSQASGAL